MDAAREATAYTYNSYGQLRTVTNAKNETTTYAYDRDQDGDGITDGYLSSVTGPLTGATTTYHYDSAKRVDSVTDSDGYILNFGYDNIDRQTSITYPDATSKQFSYNKYVNGSDTGVMTLDLGASKDRRGRWTYREYNSNRQLTKVTDPLGRNTLFDWCACGSLGSITDGNNHVTSFVRDVQGRLTSKVFVDTKSILYAYENTTSRLRSVTDAKSQVANYQYFADNDLRQISYTNTAGQPLNPATATVSFTYDPNYNRIATMLDGTGTTTYAYNPITGSISPGAGQLSSVDGRLANDTISYTYDEVGRQLSSWVNSDVQTQTLVSQTYDSLGRISTVVNPLGLSTNTYVGVSSRLQNIALPNSQSVAYGYFPNSADKRLQTIQNKTSAGAIISKFDYQYDSDGEITRLTRQLGATGFPMVWANGVTSMGDAADQLTTVIEQKSATQYGQYLFGYDSAGNRTSDNSGPHTMNNVNQITDTGYTYDNNGNQTSDPWATYEWDAGNRLTAVNYTAIGERSEFTHDGLGRRVKIVEKTFPTISLIAQPGNTNYGTYTSASASLPAGAYTLSITGLNPNGGNNTALVDAVKLNTTLVANGGFETPVLAAGAYVYRPTGASWTFVGNSGVAKNSSAFTLGNPVAPEGTQVGVVQTTGSMSQPRTLTAGTYNLNFRAAQRGNGGNGTFQKVLVKLRSNALVITSTKQYVWNGNSIAEERDANNAVTRRFYPQGEQINGASYYYMRDHLGSVRELTDSTGAVRARYDYTAFGYRTKLSGDLDAQFGFTGFYYHAPSGLNLAPYRAYDDSTGRWLSRDPIAEAGGINLYAYIGNNSMNAIDPTGLAALITVEGDAGTGITIFDPGPQSNGGPYVFPSSNSVLSKSEPGAAGPYTSPDIYIFPGPHNNKPRSYGPNCIIETDDPRYRWVHGGGWGLDDPLAPRQGWYPTHGCTRMQNEDIDELTHILLDWKGENPGQPVPYQRYWPNPYLLNSLHPGIMPG